MDTLLLLAEGDVHTGIDTLFAYGPLGVFAAVILYFVVRWGDKIASGHVELVRVCGETQARNASSLEGIRQAVDSFMVSAGVQGTAGKKTHVIIAHLARGHVAEAASPESKKHFERAVEEAQDD